MLFEQIWILKAFKAHKFLKINHNHGNVSTENLISQLSWQPDTCFTVPFKSFQSTFQHTCNALDAAQNNSLGGKCQQICAKFTKCLQRAAFDKLSTQKSLISSNGNISMVRHSFSLQSWSASYTQADNLIVKLLPTVEDSLRGR